MKVTDLQALVLGAAEKGQLRRAGDDLPAAVAGKTYAPGLGTIPRTTIDALMAVQPPLLAAGPRRGDYVALTLTATGKAALAARRALPAQHVGKARQNRRSI